MDHTLYLSAWLLAFLLAIGALSWLLARYKRRHDLRRIQAQHLLDALERYSQWVCAQRLAADHPADLALARGAAGSVPGFIHAAGGR